MQLETIAPSLQKDVIASFWTMLRELESKADDNDDPILKLWVEGWYRQWNAMTSDDKEPRWLARQKNAQNMEKVDAIARKRGLIS